MRKTIIPHLWFDTQAKEAAAFYADVFPESSVISVSSISGTPSGDVDMVSFVVWGQPFMAISAGPAFELNPSISFFVNFDPSRMPDARERLDEIWARLSEGGKALMPLDAYPFSKRYGWIQDKFGVSWQLILTNPEGEERPPIVPSLLFVGNVAGRAEEAIGRYVSTFPDSKPGAMNRYPAGMDPDKEGSVMFADFQIAGQWFAAMDSAHAHAFAFNEAVSLVVNCKDQAEIDRYWDALSAVPEAEQCGWLKDAYGVSWQIVPERMNEMMREGSKEQMARVTQAFLQMKKFDIAELERAYEGV